MLIASIAVFAEATSIELREGAFRVVGWTPPSVAPSGGWGTVFLVYAGTGKVPPLAGSYTVESGALVFHPTYPISAGVRYHAVFRTASGTLVTRDFDGPARANSPSAHVEQIYPTADVLPSNQLRLFVVFSEAMSRGEAAAHLHLQDDKGKVLADELLPGQELWDPEFRRLTMTFDPGRIKRGLTSNMTIGPPITEGKHYRLVVDREWPDSRGVPMTQGFVKVFAGGPPKRTEPDPALWRVAAPGKGTTDPLVVDFPDPMNYALLLKAIRVEHGGAAVAGTVGLDRHETQWRFAPKGPWQAGDYALVVDTGLEDLAGNHIGGLFDIDIFEKVTKTVEKKTVRLPMQIR